MAVIMLLYMWGMYTSMAANIAIIAGAALIFAVSLWLLRSQATVIKWKPDFTYATLRKGTNRLVCYDRSGQPAQPAFSVECTSVANLDRVAQNMRFEAMGDKRQAMLDAAEKDGSRVKPEFGSVFYNLSGADRDRARSHTTVAVPGATAQSLGLPDNPKAGGAWIMNAGTTTAHIMVPGH